MATEKQESNVVRLTGRKARRGNGMRAHAKSGWRRRAKWTAAKVAAGFIDGTTGTPTPVGQPSGSGFRVRADDVE
jgi:hypothetical protein